MAALEITQVSGWFCKLACNSFQNLGQSHLNFDALYTGIVSVLCTLCPKYGFPYLGVSIDSMENFLHIRLFIQQDAIALTDALNRLTTYFPQLFALEEQTAVLNATRKDQETNHATQTVAKHTNRCSITESTPEFITLVIYPGAPSDPTMFTCNATT
jgi:hypothetical protein